MAQGSIGFAPIGETGRSATSTADAVVPMMGEMILVLTIFPDNIDSTIDGIDNQVGNFLRPQRSTPTNLIAKGYHWPSISINDAEVEYVIIYYSPWATVSIYHRYPPLP